MRTLESLARIEEGAQGGALVERETGRRPPQCGSGSPRQTRRARLRRVRRTHGVLGGGESLFV